MVEKLNWDDPAGRVRALMAGILASGALATGALSVAPSAGATCAAASMNQSSCPTAGRPTQADVDAAKRDAQAAHDEVDRLRGLADQATEELWNTQNVYGVGSSDPRYREKVEGTQRALNTLATGVQKASAADDRVHTVEQAVAPTEDEIAAAKRDAQAALDETHRINQDMVKTQLEFWDAQKTFGVGSADPRYQEKTRAYTDALTAFLAAQDRSDAADERVKSLEQKSGGVATGQTQDETPRREGPTAAEVDEAKEASRLAREEVDRARTVEVQARREYENATLTNQVVSSDPLQRERLSSFVSARTDAYTAAHAALREAEDKARIASDRAAALAKKFDEVDGARRAHDELSAVRAERERLDAVFTKTWREYAKARLDFGVECQDSRCQEKHRAFEEAANTWQPVTVKEARAKALAGPSVAEIDAARKKTQAARDEAARLEDVENKIKDELNDAGKTSGADRNDPRWVEKLRAYHAADDATKSAKEKAAQAEMEEHTLQKAAEEAAAARAARDHDAKDEAVDPSAQAKDRGDAGATSPAKKEPTPAGSETERPQDETASPSKDEPSGGQTQTATTDDEPDTSGGGETAKP
ncbi:hypothetical protein MMAD_04440 [Mycolicibacterium madagascariense]|uniref:Uncharacterized protein n=1 Tax=Mycolicibacterium madagascariense TaxID=212765 RepID=A0A7I7X8I2_9MYCO|nr:hypothetical protein [Mycolicibacterium madagascariense]MCV7012902.1 hypothetical protein [Mycolicibacterium madagascariense]BBZ26149.1 hypothetical protein MMAD_04440 [Mycolicibacterium madagascariense]